LAQTLHHPFSLALALSFATWLHQFLGDVVKTSALAQAAVTLAEEQGFLFWVGWGKVLRGWAASHEADGVEAIAEIRRGLAEWRAQGSELGGAYFLSLLADALARHGDVAGALQALADARAFADKTHEHYWLAEQHRLEGELLLMREPASVAAAEALFLKARDLAARQQAASLGLRATISLARLRCRQNRPAEARGLVESMLAQFTEGFDTRDLAEAKALLAANAQ
jgi:predicted ATPase